MQDGAQLNVLQLERSKGVDFTPSELQRAARHSGQELATRGIKINLDPSCLAPVPEEDLIQRLSRPTSLAAEHSPVRSAAKI